MLLRVPGAQISLRPVAVHVRAGQNGAVPQSGTRRIAGTSVRKKRSGDSRVTTVFWETSTGGSCSGPTGRRPHDRSPPARRRWRGPSNADRYSPSRQSGTGTDAGGTTTPPCTGDGGD